MKYEEFAFLFKQQVSSLSYDEGLSLSIEICKRLFPDYVHFATVEGWGNQDLLMDAIRLCEQSRTNVVKAAAIQEKILQVDAVIPDTEDFGEYHGSYALNAGASVYETLQFILDRNPLHIYHIGTCLTDTIDFKIQEQGDTPEDKIDEHPMTVEARNFLLELSKGQRTTSDFKNQG